MIDAIVEEMHAKVLERLPMVLTLEETNEVLAALGRPFVHPGVQVLAEVQEGGATVESSEPEPSEPEPSEEPEVDVPAKKKGGKK